jgi:hypothetical protein
MQVIQLSIPHGTFYNVATGELIADANEGINTDAESLKGAWNHEVINSPDILDGQLSEAWNASFEAFEAAEDDSPQGVYMYSDYEAMLENFLSSYEQTDWVAFRVQSTVWGCGPSAELNWYVVEL